MLGGRALFERQSKAVGVEPEDKQPELFDLHVMMFADGATATAAALERTFAIDRAVAERMVNDVPLVVKRAAAPEEAAALIDALQKIGAQVVLLPSTGARPDPESDPPAAQGESWGGLDLDPRLAVRASIELASPAPPTNAAAAIPSFAPHASVIPGRASVDTAFPGLSLAPPSAEPSVVAKFWGAEPVASRAPAPEPDAALPVGPESDMPPALKLEQQDLGLGTVPPLPRVESSPPVVPSAPPAVPPIAPAARGARPPPVPAAAKRPEPPPVAGPPPIPQRASHSEVELPALQLDERARARPAAQRAPRQPQTDGYWSGRRGAAAAPATRTGSFEAPAAPRVDKAPDVASEPSRPVVVRPPEASDSDDDVAYSPAPGVFAIVGSLAALYLGVQLGNSVFQGTASSLSLIAHGLAFYAFGWGVARLRK